MTTTTPTVVHSFSLWGNRREGTKSHFLIDHEDRGEGGIREFRSGVSNSWPGPLS